MFKKKKKDSDVFSKRVYDFYKEHNIPFDNPPLKSPEEYAKDVINEMNKRFNQGSNTIKLSGTSESGRLI